MAASTYDATAWNGYASASSVSTYYANGASQLAWQFRLKSVHFFKMDVRHQPCPVLSRHPW